jgi:hypothetical protein
MITIKQPRTASMVLLLCGLLLGVTGCTALRTSDANVSHDRILWARGNAAFDHQRCDVGRLTLQTLINTYPGSKYAAEAGRVVKDPTIAGCREPLDLWVQSDFDFDP